MSSLLNQFIQWGLFYEQYNGNGLDLVSIEGSEESMKTELYQSSSLL